MISLEVRSAEADTARRPLLRVTMEEMKSWLRERNEPPMRARQLRRWLFAGRATSFEQMTDLPRRLREELAQDFTPLGTAINRHLVSTDGTHKLLLRLDDGQVVECVLLQEADRRTVCVSTQVGCGMGCVFCASGIGGVVRNLRTDEIIEQLLQARNLLPADEIVEQLLQARNLLPADERLSHIVVMGMGEPLANLDNLLAALEMATSPDGLGIGARHIHISTVGIPSRIRQLAELGRQYHLAVSLHAPNDELRSRIVPTNAKTGIAAILEAADYFQEKTSRQVTYEYVLLRGENDAPKHAAELARLLRGRQAHVNLIPFNDVVGLPYHRLSEAALEDFVAVLKRGGVSVKVRKRKGADIDAACGQLRRAALDAAGRAEIAAPLAGPEPLSATGV